jgi:flagellar hook protein FlgE
MSIQKSLYIGLSGLKTNGEALNVVGDNIANINTIGFKASRTIFQDILGQTLLGTFSNTSIGGGVQATSVERMFEQGALLGTGVATDLAVAGEGFFAVEGSSIGTEGIFYTRAGQFHVDHEGFLVNPSSLRLQGYTVKSDGTIGSSLGDINIDDVPFPPSASSAIDMVINLDAEVAIDSNPFDPLKPNDTSAFAAGVTLYDPQGKSYPADVYFQKTADNQWEYFVVVDGKNLEGGVEGDGTVVAQGALQFTLDGKLASDTQTVGPVFQPKGGAVQDIEFDFGKSIADGGLGDDSTTQYAAKSATSSIFNDGAQAGSFQNLNIDAEGRVIGHFSNGKERLIAQVTLARFKSNTGLRSQGYGLFVETSSSGTPTFGEPGAGGRGNIRSGSLEQSTVDLANEFTRMIVTQRGYQANGRSISTANEMLMEVMNLKR